MPYSSSQVCHIGLIVFLFFLLAQKGLEVQGRKLRRESFEELNTETEEDVAAPVYYQGVDGQPGVDFPTLSFIPRTSFSCAEMESGYYADTETGCQVFHICNNGAKVSFLCPNGTIFQQSELICEWWFKVNCSEAPSLYQESAEQFQLDTIRRKESRRVTGTTRPTNVTKETPGHQKTSSMRRNNHGTSTTSSSTIQYHQNQGPTVYKSSNGRKSSNNINRVTSDEPKTSGFQRNGFQSTSRIPVAISYEETQIPEESGSFVRSRFNSISSSRKSTTENPYPNHRKSYSDIQNPKEYGKSYSKLPEKSFYGTSLGPGSLSTIPVLPLDASVTKSPSTIPGVLNGSDPTTISQYDVPPGYSVDGVAVVTTEIQQKITNAEISTTESKLIFLKTTTQSPRRSGKTVKGTEASSLDFNVNSISVIPSGIQSRSTTERNYYTSTTSNPPTTTSGSKTDGSTIPDSVPTGSPRIGFDYFGTTERSQQESTLSPNQDGRESNGIVYTTAFPRGFTVSSTPKNDISTIQTRINNPDDNNVVDFTLSTIPTPYFTSTTTSNPRSEVTDENMKDYINSLIKIAEERLNKDEDESRFATSRPDLIVPPSVSPNTLHSLALYFANAADINHIHPEDDFMNLNITASEERSVIDMLLTEATRVGYESLFKDQNQQTLAVTTTAMPSTTSDDEDPNYPPQNTSVRELARLFTSALSSYLDDPENFRKTLQGVRPTEPPVEGRTERNPEDEEVLNFSDSDLSVKSPPGNAQSTTTESTTGPTTTAHDPYVVTSQKPGPTLGFVIAYDNNRDSDNSIDHNGENLQTADSQSFVSQNGNSIVPEKDYGQKTTVSYTETTEPPVVTYRPKPTANYILAYEGAKNPTSTGLYTTESFDQGVTSTKDGLPNNHWTTSSDVTKLLQTALALDPLTVNFLTTSGISGTTTESFTAGDEITETSTKNIFENAESLYAEATGDNTKLNNVLRSIMKNTTNEKERVRLILDKLNLTEDEFRNRMKEIESNPLAKRLVLLLVNQCNKNNNEEVGTTNEIGSTTEQTTETNKITTEGGGGGNTRNPQRGDDNVFRKFVDENLTDENEDTRALQLLNSLYVIASKFNK